MTLKKFIKETVQKELVRLREDSYLEEFSLDELRDCYTPEDAKEYLDNHLEIAGEGSYRITYGLDDNTVIKFAKQDIMQNAQEVRNARCLPKSYVVQIFDKHPEFWWIVMERLQKLSRAEFVAAFEQRIGAPVPYKPDGKGYDLEQKESKIMTAIEFGSDSTNQNSLPEHTAWMRNKWYAGLIAALRKCQVQADDFHHKNWGIRSSTGDLVLLDLGF